MVVNMKNTCKGLLGLENTLVIPEFIENIFVVLFFTILI
jgi:hypothetical protein